MKPKVGIPRALLYYNYFPVYRTFLERVGAEVVVSRPTTKEVVNAGVRECVDEACLPVKLFYGHVLDLAERVDYLFLPRIVSVSRGEYTCPKFMGIPDMIRCGIERPLPPIISPTINLNRTSWGLGWAAWEVARRFTRNPWVVAQASKESLEALRLYRQLMRSGLTCEEALARLGSGLSANGPVAEPQGSSLTIGLVGHPYNLYDHTSSMGLVKKLRESGARVITPEMLAPDVMDGHTSTLDKALFWTYERDIVGAAFHFLRDGVVDGLITLAAFGCGPDSLSMELVELETKEQSSVPYLALTMDEHTGEAGLQTRLEAFLDMTQMQKRRREMDRRKEAGVCGEAGKKRAEEA